MFAKVEPRFNGRDETAAPYSRPLKRALSREAVDDVHPVAAHAQISDENPIVQRDQEEVHGVDRIRHFQVCFEDNEFAAGKKIGHSRIWRKPAGDGLPKALEIRLRKMIPLEAADHGRPTAARPE
jgi:hypothetical protein